MLSVFRCIADDFYEPAPNISVHVLSLLLEISKRALWPRLEAPGHPVHFALNVVVIVLGTAVGLGKPVALVATGHVHAGM